MFLDSDLNGGSWGSFDEDYSNFGNSVGNSLKSITSYTRPSTIGGSNIYKSNPNNSGKYTGNIFGGNPIKNGEITKGLKEKYLSKANSFSQENRYLRLQLKKAEENNKNMMMYGLLGIIAILLLNK